MSQFIIRHCDKDRSVIMHGLNHEKIITDRPPEYGGEGRSFSCTDLVASSLGSCFFSSAVPILEREGIDPSTLEVEVIKQLGEAPKQISAIKIVINSSSALEDVVRTKLRNALSNCPVRRSLRSDMKIELSFASLDP